MPQSRLSAARFALILITVASLRQSCEAQTTKPKSPPAAERSSQARDTDLSQRWRSIQLAVGRADVAMDMAFHSSLSEWRDPANGLNRTKIQDGDLTSPLDFPDETTVVIKGDCRDHLSLPKGGVVHIYGDLLKSIKIGGQGEIVIAGRVAPSAAIEAEEIQHVFVGSDLSGLIRSKGAIKIFVGGNFTGTIETGEPNTNLTLRGDLTGQIKPLKRGALLYLLVDGYTSYAKLEAIAKSSYVEFDASIGSSDRDPGFYPGKFSVRNCCWTIQKKK